MNILILGAAGRTGRELLRAGHARGHTITAFARTPVGLSDEDGIRVLAGSASDPAALDEAMRGQEVVINVMAPARAEDPQDLTRALERLVVAMRQHRTARYVGVSFATLSLPGDHREYVGSVTDRFTRAAQRRHFLAKAQQAELLRRSGLDWSLARAPRLSAGKGTGYIISLIAPAGPRLTRYDLAQFLLDEAEVGRYVGAAPFIATGRPDR